MNFVDLAYRMIFGFSVAAAFAYPSFAQHVPADLRVLLARSCAMTDDQLGRIVGGEIVVTPLPKLDKKEISLCGAVRLSRASPPTISELRESLNQRENRSVLAGGPFGDPPSKSDLSALKVEDKDLAALLKCRLGNCSVLVSDALLQKLPVHSDRRPETLGNLYAEDLVGFARDFRLQGVNALNTFRGSSVSASLVEQHRSLLERVPILGARAPALLLYVMEFPARSLPGTETKLSWTKVNFGLRPIVTVSSTTDYSPGDGPPIVVTHQIYASRYVNGSIAVATIVEDEAGRLFLLFANISRSDAVGGLFSGLKRSIVTDEGIERIRDLLALAKTRLEIPTTRSDEASPASSKVESQGSPIPTWLNARSLAAAVLALMLLIFGIRSYRRTTIADH